MATDKKTLFVNGGNGAVAGTPAEEEARARDLARRYRCEFLDLRTRGSHPPSVQNRYYIREFASVRNIDTYDGIGIHH